MISLQQKTMITSDRNVAPPSR